MKLTPESNVGSAKGYSLIIPSLSVGNVGQLAVDILLATLKPERVGGLFHPAILPVVGSDPLALDSSHLMTACEVFKSDDLKLLFVQVRSCVSKSRKDEFIDDLIRWASDELEIGQLIVLASLSADERTDSQISGDGVGAGGGVVRFLTNAQEKREELLALQWQELERKSNFPSLPANADVRQADSLYIPGGGLAKTIHNKCLNAEKLTLVELLTFASEGDNTGDAIRMVAFVDQWLKVIPKAAATGRPTLKFPVSWQNMFGNPAPQIY